MRNNMNPKKTYVITNRNGTYIGEWEANSFYDAWHMMFEACKYPKTSDARSITAAIEQGLWIERKCCLSGI